MRNAIIAVLAQYEPELLKDLGPKPVDEFIREFMSYKFTAKNLGSYVLVPFGYFNMGSDYDDSESYADEHPAHRVTLTKSFYLKATPVTQAEWEEVMGFNPSKFKGANRPVEQVSWYEAVAYCNALSQREGLEPAYDLSGVSGKPGGEEYKIEQVKWNQGSLGYRLPTEAEWEYACRAGTTTPRYGELDRIAWYDKNSENETHPVGQKEPNEWGLYDMLGNVWEWVFDTWKRDYTTASVVDPVYVEAGAGRVERGGCWFSKAGNCRAAIRDSFDPGYRSFNLGFRPCRNMIQERKDNADLSSL